MREDELLYRPLIRALKYFITRLQQLVRKWEITTSDNKVAEWDKRGGAKGQEATGHCIQYVDVMSTPPICTYELE